MTRLINERGDITDLTKKNYKGKLYTKKTQAQI